MTEVQELDVRVLQRAAVIAAYEFELNAALFDCLDDAERHFHEDVILDAALQQAKEEASADVVA